MIFRRHKRVFGLGLGELSTILLAKEIGAAMVLIDEALGRRLAREEGLEVRGSVGILENLLRRREIDDLPAAFEKLLVHQVDLDRDLLNRRLHLFGLPPLLIATTITVDYYPLTSRMW